MSQTPKSLGFTMPAEWEGHSAVWLAWPHDETTFPDRVAKVEKRYCEMIKALEGSEKVELIVLNENEKIRISRLLADFGIVLISVNFHVLDYADVWIRDYGPIFLTDKNNNLGWVKVIYYGYGKAEDPYFAPLVRDNEVFNEITLPGKRFDINMVLEGGSIEVDGSGNLITTKQCLLNSNRNPKLNQQQIEQKLKDYFGVNNIIWLNRGLINDHTDGHVDDLTRFVAPKKVLTCFESDPEDENYKILEENYQTLTQAGLEVIKLPMPHMKYDDGRKAPVSYANFYIGNKVVLVPTYNDTNDSKALEIIQNCFPTRKVVGIDGSDLIYGGGSVHCVTQQQR